MKNYQRGTTVLAVIMCIAYAATLAGAPDIGTPVDAAPDAEDTRLQKWPRAAWAAETKCWLAVWREGALDEGKTDIWCARIAPDGTTLDPKGIRITAAAGIKDRPTVASNGKDWLVAWNDFRNGKDWDVYAARVSGDGKPLDGDGLPLIVGPQNQCQPTVVFAAENYLVAWQGFVNNTIHYKSRSMKMDFGSYQVRGTRVSPEGKTLDTGGKVLAAMAIQPCFSLDNDGNAWLAFIGHLGDKISTMRTKHFPAIVRIDAATCAPQGDASSLGKSGVKRSNARDFGGGGAPLSVAWLKNGSGILAGRGYLGGTTLFRFDKDGKNVGDAVKIQHGQFRHVMAVSSLAVSGEKILLVRDWPYNKPRSKPNMGVWGRMLPPEGEIAEDTADRFPIAVKEGKDRVQSFACAGPDGTFLVVYADPRGPEDTKVVARILK